MTLQLSDFSLKNTRLLRFNFQLKPVAPSSDNVKLQLSYNVKASYKKEDENAYIFLEVNMKAIDIDTPVFTVDALLNAYLESEKFEEKFLKNASAMMYSYLRPIIAQSSVFSKLPPLDLPALNFQNFELINMDEVESD